MPRVHAVWAVTIVAVLLSLLALTGCSQGLIAATGTGRTTPTSQPQWDRTIRAETAGVTFGVPDGWNSDPRAELTLGERTLLFQDGDAEALVIVGDFEGLFLAPGGEASLQQVAHGNATSFGEFFFPTPGQRQATVDRKLQIDGHPAHLVEYFIHADDGTQSTSRFLVVLGPRAPVFAAFLHQDLPPAQVEEGNRVLATLQLDDR